MTAVAAGGLRSLQHPEELTLDLLNALIDEAHPGTCIEGFEIVETRRYGDADNATSVSTSARARCRLHYRAGSNPALPSDIVVKMSLPDDLGTANPDLDAEFINEVNFYRKLRPELSLETPQALGGAWDPASRRYLLLIEDLTPRQPHFHSMVDEDDVAAVRAVLTTLAVLHARFWESPRLSRDLSWVESQVAGPLEDLFDGPVHAHILRELAREKFKRELVAELGTSEAELYAGMKALKRHQATLPCTFLHGDAHFGNSYGLPDGTGGLLDWQVSARGFLMHDIGYFIQSALSIEARRTHERALLDHYREALRAEGVVAPPDREMLWLEYRRSMIYGFYMGWITAPRENYGLEVCFIGNHRTQVACQDHETVRLVSELL